MKAIEGREAKLEVAKMKLERDSKLKNTSTHHKDCQTDGYIDVYDSVTTADEETYENLNQVTSESPVSNIFGATGLEETQHGPYHLDHHEAECGQLSHQQPRVN